MVVGRVVSRIVICVSKLFIFSNVVRFVVISGKVSSFRVVDIRNGIEVLCNVFSCSLVLIYISFMGRVSLFSGLRMVVNSGWKLILKKF